MNPIVIITSFEIVRQLEDVNILFGKDVECDILRRQPRGTYLDTQYWRKKSIFFELPYWENNIILDVMHIEKNQYKK